MYIIELNNLSRTFRGIRKIKIMKINLLLGIAAGVGVAIFLNSKNGKAFLESLSQQAWDLTDKAKDLYNEGQQKAKQYASDAEHSVRNVM